MTSSQGQLDRLVLALSGGGIRAVAFHMGVLLRLARQQLIEKVVAISTVSGGSLATALVFSSAQCKWPSSVEFERDVFPNIKTLLTKSSIERALPLAFLDNLFTRGMVGSWMLSQALYDVWGIRAQMSDLPESPLWFVNASTYETGKNWRFTRSEMGDWRFGHYYYGRDVFDSRSSLTYEMPVSVAVAASAGFPYLLGLLRLTIPSGPWFQVDPRNSLPIRKQDRRLKRVRLWDGGVYDNLGLEPVYKPNEGISFTTQLNHDKRDAFLVVSDASAPIAFDDGPALGPIDWKEKRIRGSLRMPDIATDQTRALRSRMIMHAVKKGDLRAAYVRMGLPTSQIKTWAEADYPERTVWYDHSSSLLASEVEFLAAISTRLCKISGLVFDSLARHGYETTDATLACHHPKFFRSIPF